MSKPTYIDLFAGAGGLSEGFLNAGFKPIAHVEMDEAACNTLKTRIAFHHLKSKDRLDIYYSYLKGEISRNELYDKIPSKLLDSVINLPVGYDYNNTIHEKISTQLKGKKVDLIIGGPPCQAYSVVGRARSKTGMEGDPRNFLYIQYANFLEKYKPKFFLFENVLGLKSAKQGLYLEKMKTLFLAIGYKFKLFTLEANNFGVLQNRKRVIILGWRKKQNPSLPNLETIRSSSIFFVKSIFSDLPKIGAGQGVDKYSHYSSKTNEYLEFSAIRNCSEILTQHFARPNQDQDKEIYRIVVNKWNNAGKRLNYNDLPEYLKTHRNRHSFTDRFKVVANNLPYSHTVVAHIAKDGHYYIHPDIEQNRSISVREAARLQSFPDNYYFEGVKEGKGRTSAFKQIGNAVPPLMASTIAFQIKELL